MASPTTCRPLRFLGVPHARIQNVPTDARKLFIVGWDIEIETTHDMVRFETFAERHDAREVDVVHGQVEVQEGGGFGEELGEGDGACRGHLGRGEKEAFEGGVECKRCTQRLDLESELLEANGMRKKNWTYTFKSRPRAGVSAEIQRLQTQVVFLTSKLSMGPC